MCSVRQSPTPTAPNLSATCGDDDGDDGDDNDNDDGDNGGGVDDDDDENDHGDAYYIDTDDGGNDEKNSDSLKKNLCVVAAISVCVHLCKHKSVCVYL
jgi:hypothetical protein